VILGKAKEWGTLSTRVSFAIGETPTRDGTITPEVEAVILRELQATARNVPGLFSSPCRTPALALLRSLP
jgi:hypothetical protein